MAMGPGKLDPKPGSSQDYVPNNGQDLRDHSVPSFQFDSISYAVALGYNNYKGVDYLFLSVIMASIFSLDYIYFYCKCLRGPNLDSCTV